MNTTAPSVRRFEGARRICAAATISRQRNARPRSPLKHRNSSSRSDNQSKSLASGRRAVGQSPFETRPTGVERPSSPSRGCAAQISEYSRNRPFGRPSSNSIAPSDRCEPALVSKRRMGMGSGAFAFSVRTKPRLPRRLKSADRHIIVVNGESAWRRPGPPSRTASELGLGSGRLAIERPEIFAAAEVTESKVKPETATISCNCRRRINSLVI